MELRKNFIAAIQERETGPVLKSLLSSRDELLLSRMDVTAAHMTERADLQSLFDHHQSEPDRRRIKLSLRLK
ncbi:hypothetical protein [Bradyrhizobium valentinum]|uniref:hypothetical protein n=1 Tax=Bradyrhizobium valentinum TaxID=1518501 RepID=UPI0012E3AE3F|nr:hypothetical protein [Bradyrhizobium valentinum]